MYSMAKRRRKLSPELEKNISLAKKEIELITAIIHDIDEEDIQEEYMSAFLPVMSTYMSLDQMYKELGLNDASFWGLSSPTQIPGTDWTLDNTGQGFYGNYGSFAFKLM